MSGESSLPEGVVAAPEGTPLSELRAENAPGLGGLAGTTEGTYPVGFPSPPVARALFPPLPAKPPFKPAFDRLLLEPVDSKTRTASGLHMVETPTFLMGRVIAKGDGVLLQNGAFEVGPFTEGQVVAYQPLPGTFHRMPMGGKTYWVVQMSSVIGAFDDDVLPSIVQEPAAEKGTQIVTPQFSGEDPAADFDADNDER